MGATRVFSIAAWLLLPTVMFGGYSLLSLMNAGDGLTPFQVTYFRAGHGHAGVLLIVALVFHSHLDKTAFSERVKWGICLALFTSILAISGGFFLHMIAGEEGASSVGTVVTGLGALLLVYGLVRAPRGAIPLT